MPTCITFVWWRRWRSWRRACACEAHKSPDFAIRIDASDRPPDVLALEIARVLSMPKVLA
jgi:hypothetical protein